MPIDFSHEGVDKRAKLLGLRKTVALKTKIVEMELFDQK